MTRVTIDKYGRIVIPKPVRERLGLEPGSALELELEMSESGQQALALRPASQEPAIRRSGDLLVHTGRLTDEAYDVVQHLRHQREERSQKLSGR